MSRKQLLLLAAAAVLLLGGPGAWLAFRGGASPAAGWEVHADDRTLGDPKAKLVLIEYAAPTCPHCAEFNEQVFPDLKRAYIDTGKIFYVLRVLATNPADGAAEKLARCAPQDRYFAALDTLFRNQALWSPGAGVLDLHGGLMRIGRMLGLEAAQVDACLNSTAEDARINRNSEEAFTRYEVRRVPTFLLNGVTVFEGVPSMETLTQILEGSLAAQ